MSRSSHKGHEELSNDSIEYLCPIMAREFDLSELSMNMTGNRLRLKKNMEAIFEKYEKANFEEDDVIDLTTLTIAHEGRRGCLQKLTPRLVGHCPLVSTLLAEEMSSCVNKNGEKSVTAAATFAVKVVENLDATGLENCPEMKTWMDTFQGDSSDAESLTCETDSDSDVLWEDDDDFLFSSDSMSEEPPGGAHCPSLPNKEDNSQGKSTEAGSWWSLGQSGAQPSVPKGRKLGLASPAATGQRKGSAGGHRSVVCQQEPLKRKGFKKLVSTSASEYDHSGRTASSSWKDPSVHSGGELLKEALQRAPQCKKVDHSGDVCSMDVQTSPSDTGPAMSDFSRPVCSGESGLAAKACSEVSLCTEPDHPAVMEMKARNHLHQDTREAGTVHEVVLLRSQTSKTVGTPPKSASLRQSSPAGRESVSTQLAVVTPRVWSTDIGGSLVSSPLETGTVVKSEPHSPSLCSAGGFSAASASSSPSSLCQQDSLDALFSQLVERSQKIAETCHRRRYRARRVLRRSPALSSEQILHILKSPMSPSELQRLQENSALFPGLQNGVAAETGDRGAWAAEGESPKVWTPAQSQAAPSLNRHLASPAPPPPAAVPNGTKQPAEAVKACVEIGETQSRAKKSGAESRGWEMQKAKRICRVEPRPAGASPTRGSFRGGQCFSPSSGLSALHLSNSPHPRPMSSSSHPRPMSSSSHPRPMSSSPHPRSVSSSLHPTPMSGSFHPKSVSSSPLLRPAVSVSSCPKSAASSSPHPRPVSSSPRPRSASSSSHPRSVTNSSHLRPAVSISSCPKSAASSSSCPKSAASSSCCPRPAASARTECRQGDVRPPGCVKSLFQAAAWQSTVQQDAQTTTDRSSLGSGARTGAGFWGSVSGKGCQSFRGVGQSQSPPTKGFKRIASE